MAITRVDEIHHCSRKICLEMVSYHFERFAVVALLDYIQHYNQAMRQIQYRVNTDFKYMHYYSLDVVDETRQYSSSVECGPKHAKRSYDNEV